jgi:hypothetical protein
VLLLEHSAADLVRIRGVDPFGAAVFPAATPSPGSPPLATLSRKR